MFHTFSLKVSNDDNNNNNTFKFFKKTVLHVENFFFLKIWVWNVTYLKIMLFGWYQQSDSATQPVDY